ncbi:MAG: hypothetical protein JNM31_15465 [Flavobacteriales bacterium]|nr:hypothetical protein [Flavobacteriales bacterium]
MLKQILLSTVLLAAMPAIAQNTSKADQDPVAAGKSHTSELVQKLGLSVDQAKQIEPLMITAAKEAAPLYAEGDAGKKKASALYDKYYGEMVGMLTPEQAQKFLEMRKAGQIDGGACAPSKAGCGSSAAKPGCCASKATAAAPVPAAAPVAVDPAQ